MNQYGYIMTSRNNPNGSDLRGTSQLEDKSLRVNAFFRNIDKLALRCRRCLQSPRSSSPSPARRTWLTVNMIRKGVSLCPRTLFQIPPMMTCSIQYSLLRLPTKAKKLESHTPYPFLRLWNPQSAPLNPQISKRLRNQL